MNDKHIATLQTIRTDGGCVDDADYIAAIDAAIVALRSSGEAMANDDAGAGPVTRHHCFIYEVDFGDEGKGRYVRLADFNRVVEELEAHPATPASAWRPIAEAPFSTQVAQVFFLAYCPDADWAPMGRMHMACRYQHDAADEVRVIGSPQARKATHWMCPTPPASTSQTAAEQAALER